MMQSGLGIRPELFDEVFTNKPKLAFLEAHSENYFGDSLTRQKLLELREHYPMSLHGVGLSLGRADDLDQQHLTQLKSLIDDIEPILVSEHLAWSAYSHQHIPDLLPLPLTESSFQVMCDHVDRMQNSLGRQILVENPSNYLVFDALQIDEAEFLNSLAKRTGCGLLVDVNNIYVSAKNIGRDPKAYIDALNSKVIGQFHLAGHTEITREFDGVQETLMIDTHNQPVRDSVWELYDHTLERHGVRPTLLEWDSDFPEFSVLLNECETVSQAIDEYGTIDLKTPKAVAFDAVRKVISNTEETLTNGVCELSDIQNGFLQDLVKLNSQHNLVVEHQRHRISVYQNNYFGAMQDYLAQVFPAAKGVLGDEFFKQTMRSLVQRFPPHLGDINRYGYQLIDFLPEVESLESLPYLIDLLRYEWALHDVYYASIDGALDPSNLSQEALLEVPVKFNESVHLIKSEFPIYEIHRQSLPDYTGEVSISLEESQDNLMVFKQDVSVQTVVLSQALKSTLEQIKKDQNLLQAITELSGSMNIDPNELSGCLSFILENRLLMLLDVETT